MSGSPSLPPGAVNVDLQDGLSPVVLMAALPTPDGFKFVSPKGWKPTMPRSKGQNHGAIDKRGYEWEKGPNHNFKNEIDPRTNKPYDYEYDVQFRDGTGNYYNVNPKFGPDEPGD